MQHIQTLCIFLGFLFAAATMPSMAGQRTAFFDAEDRHIKFRAVEEYYPVRLASPGSNVLPLEPAVLPDEFNINYEWNGATYSLDDFNKRTNTNALLILKDGQVVTEIYRNGTTPETRFISFSTAKSVTSTLVGIAYEDGLIDDLADPLTKYLPALVGSAYDGVTIRDALQMLSGVEWDEASYDWEDETKPLIQLWKGAMVENRYRFVEGANTLPRAHPPGTKYNYNTLDSSILGWLVETVTQQRLTQFMEERLWHAVGMEFEATWALDGPESIGREMAGAALNATLRDYGRYGLLMANGGTINGKQIISQDWVTAATTPDREPIMFGNLGYGPVPLEDYEQGYGYQWWLFPNGHYEAEGVYGQFIYVAPEENVVIVKLSYWPDAWANELQYEGYAFFTAAIEALR